MESGARLVLPFDALPRRIPIDWNEELKRFSIAGQHIPFSPGGGIGLLHTSPEAGIAALLEENNRSMGSKLIYLARYSPTGDITATCSETCSIGNGSSNGYSGGAPLLSILSQDSGPGRGLSLVDLEQISDDPSDDSSSYGSYFDDDEDDDEDVDVETLFAPSQPRPSLSVDHPFAKYKDSLAEAVIATLLRGELRELTTSRETQQKDLSEDMGMQRTPATTPEPPVKALEKIPDLGFACPLFLHDPQKHRDRRCLSYPDLLSPIQVRQHLWESHRRPHHCPICLDIFSTAADCNSHIRSFSCAPQTTPEHEVEGIHEDTMEQIARWRPHNPETMSEEEQWFSLWDIVFPGEERPVGIRLSEKTEAVRVARIARDYWMENGRGVVLEFLESRGAVKESFDGTGGKDDLEVLAAAVSEKVIGELLVGLARGGLKLPRQHEGWNESG
ncbi:hypothetical protein B0T19DRAFT_445571 [Cercophora scortea]|uniref:Uncharacterized protein n=1 Tax=Cercophora scortea TaxID=314031 RepID=A0AAE0M6K4_9PEZI|nr:hypothetical protein B0T19DRAFT_445571 [Cercophora scortea]